MAEDPSKHRLARARKTAPRLLLLLFLGALALAPARARGLLSEVASLGHSIERSIEQMAKGRPLAHLIAPGTKWCGNGDIAKNYDDLGTDRETDKCCREHDHCPDYIEALQSKYGLHNGAIYTRLNCSCDLKFRDCLKKANSHLSLAIGEMYFNILNTQCYKKDYPITSCAIRTLIRVPLRCVKYNKDETLPPKWQWFDEPLYFDPPYFHPSEHA